MIVTQYSKKRHRINIKITNNDQLMYDKWNGVIDREEEM
jgi:hypothetical protein